MTSSVNPFEFLHPSGRGTVRAGFVAYLAAAAIAVLAQESASEQEGGMGFGRLVPIGYVSRQVRIPSFGKDGKPASVFTADTLVRIDDQRLQAGNCVVELAGKTAKEDVHVEMTSAIYHMTERTLRSGERSRVTRADLEMEGDSMVFDTTSSIGQMKGRVRTIIFDTTPVSGQSSGAAPASAN